MTDDNTTHTISDAKTAVADKLAEFKTKIESLISVDRFHDVKTNIKEIIEHTQNNYHHLDKEVKTSLKNTAKFLAVQKKELEQFQNKINALLNAKKAKKAATKKTAARPAVKAKKKAVAKKPVKAAAKKSKK